jgi:hypothetical protein
LKLKMNDKTIRNDEQAVDKKLGKKEEPVKKIPALDVAEELAFCEANDLVPGFRNERAGTVRCDVRDSAGNVVCWARGFDQTRALKQAIEQVVAASEVADEEDAVTYENTSAAKPDMIQQAVAQMPPRIKEHLKAAFEPRYETPTIEQLIQQIVEREVREQLSSAMGRLLEF